MDRAGYYSLEVWGGATFDSAIRFLNEDPWERLREIRKKGKEYKTSDASERTEPLRIQTLC